MKIALGMNITQGPYGGGNQFGDVMVKYLKDSNVPVVFDLKDADIDLILMTDPRRQLSSVTFGPIEIERYLRKINHKAIVVHRINECDERKGTKTVNNLLSHANKVADHTIYIGSWLIDLMKNQNMAFTPRYNVILNGADRNIFQYKKKELPNKEKIKIVTHHWSSNYMKGWDIYQFIDDQISNNPLLSNKFEFHYIGNAPDKIKTTNIIFHSPCNGIELAKKLHQCHIYLTASINEPAGMHHIEGASCGLPLLFLNSGALPEYCTGFGVPFMGKPDVIEGLMRLVKNYTKFSEKLRLYDKNSLKMSMAYYNLFVDLVNSKNTILKNRPPDFYSIRKGLFFHTYFNFIRILNRFGIH